MKSDVLIEVNFEKSVPLSALFNKESLSSFTKKKPSEAFF
ncbi:hypothetical protein CCAN2_2000079 [Capnocytophaga canimorsus]|nr:hypothetical protein CCAN2_2000079 [Capnocytophaga canimorsus]